MKLRVRECVSGNVSENVAIIKIENKKENVVTYDGKFYSIVTSKRM